MSEIKQVDSKTAAEKERQQIIFLAVLMAVAGLYFGYTQLMQPKMAGVATLEDKLEKSKLEVRKIKNALQNKDKVDATFEASYRKIAFLNDASFPPEKNPLMWIGTFVGEVSTRLGIPANKRAYKPVGAASMISLPPPKKGSKDPGSFFEDYLFEVEVEGSAHLIGRFVAELERALPFAHIVKLNIERGNSSLRGVVRCAVPRFNAKGREQFEKMTSLMKKKGGR